VELRQFVMLAFQVSILCIVFGFGLRACRHPGIALSIASANFPDEQFAGTILLYLIINAVVGMAYLGWRRRQVWQPRRPTALGAHMRPQNGASSYDR
jgi:hypothetical protein